MFPLTWDFSVVLASITTQPAPCCHTIDQKSSMVSFSGACVAMYASFCLYPCWIEEMNAWVDIPPLPARRNVRPGSQPLKRPRPQDRECIRDQPKCQFSTSTLSFPNSKSTFSQSFQRKYLSEVVRIDSILIFHLSKLWKATFFKLGEAIFLVRL